MRVFLTRHFKRQVKTLQKKFPHAKSDFRNAFVNLDLSRALAIGRSVYKIRIKSSDMTKGKSGGFRCYFYFFVKAYGVAPVCMYVKSMKASLTKDELQDHIDRVFEEIVLPATR